MRVRVPVPLLAAAALVGCADLTAPVLEAMPQEVAAFVEASGLPDVRSYVEPVRDDARDVLVFTVEWGAPQDCLGGCFHFSATGLRHGGRIGWLEVQGAYAAPAAELVPYDFLAGEQALFGDALLAALRDGDPFDHYLYGVYRLRLVADPDVPEAVIVRLASRLDTEGWPFLATTMLQRSGPPRCETGVLEEIGGLGEGSWSWGPAPEQARRALAECG